MKTKLPWWTSCIFPGGQPLGAVVHGSWKNSERDFTRHATAESSLENRMPCWCRINKYVYSDVSCVSISRNVLIHTILYYWKHLPVYRNVPCYKSAIQFIWGKLSSRFWDFTYYKFLGFSYLKFLWARQRVLITAKENQSSLGNTVVRHFFFKVGIQSSVSSIIIYKKASTICLQGKLYLMLAVI